MVEAPPPALAANIEHALRAVGGRDPISEASPEMLLLAAERVFERMLGVGCLARSSALQLLVVDALVTYAFERASDDPERLEERAERAMIALAALSSAPANSATG